MKQGLSRRELLHMVGMTGLGMMVHPLGKLVPFKKEDTMRTRPIPSTGEELPVVGLGTWRQFDVSTSEPERAPLKKVLKLMDEYGGKVIDSSPMYGRSEEVIGDLTTETDLADQFFYATKVWTNGRQSGINQMEASLQKMRRDTIDLMQVHNLVDWQTHLQTMRQWKEEGKIRYTGVTHYTVTAHNRLEQIVKNEDIDFVQFNYSIGVRNAEKSLLDAAHNNDVAVIINEPYEGGSLFRRVGDRKVPDWATEYDIESWGQFFLKYILSHPAVTCVIPGTSDPEHLVDNMGAGYGRSPGEKGRRKMANYFDSL